MGSLKKRSDFDVWLANTYNSVLLPGNFILYSGSVYEVIETSMEEDFQVSGLYGAVVVRRDGAKEEKMSVSRFFFRDAAAIFTGSREELDNIRDKAVKAVRNGGNLEVDKKELSVETGLSVPSAKVLEEQRERTAMELGNNQALSFFVQQEVEEMKRELENKMRMMQEKLEAVIKPMQMVMSRVTMLIRQLGIYSGIGNSLKVLQEGLQDSTDSPAYIYQLPFYMDEEVGDPSDSGLDFTRIEDFDAWLVKVHPKFKEKNYHLLLPHSKSIAVFRVRRNPKVKLDVWANIAHTVGDSETYILIRSGDYVCRLWAEIGGSVLQTGAEFFPNPDELIKGKNRILDELGKEKEDSYNYSKKLEEKTKFEEQEFKYRLNLLLIQGLLDREEIFPSLKGVDLFAGDILKHPSVKFLFNNMDSTLLDSQIPLFRDFKKENNKDLKEGDRIIWLAPSHYYEMPYRERSYSYTREEDEARRFNDRVNRDNWANRLEHTSPQMGIYIVEEDKEEGLYISYHPGGMVRSGWGWNESERKNRLKFAIKPEDWLLCFDGLYGLGIEYLESIMYDRKNRRSYLTVMRLLPAAIEILKAEYEKEKLFVEVIYNYLLRERTEFESFDKSRVIKKIEQAVIWYKTKNKWKRPLPVGDWEELYPGQKSFTKEKQKEEEGKAVRIVLKKLYQYYNE